MTNGNDAARVVYDPHARRQMRDRRITEQQVEMVLANYHTSYPAEPLPHVPGRSIVYIGEADGRDLKVLRPSRKRPAVYQDGRLERR